MGYQAQIKSTINARRALLEEEKSAATRRRRQLTDENHKEIETLENTLINIESVLGSMISLCNEKAAQLREDF
ncbi:Uncharacterised protein [Listeria grayi]|uniref:Uncharacterized protein n=1 Tax=Listeria grayi TaxID=1641 RepID=A0A378MB06_LISGR|nr:hypothetical protein [Listeria grayi]STY43528.1 Uncharacterised protein [Listeria grayi]